MKKYVVLVMVICAFVYAGCQNVITQKDKGDTDANVETSVVRFSIMTFPTKTVYDSTGDSIDLTGLEAAVKYEDGKEDIVHYSDDPESFKTIDFIKNGDIYQADCSYKNYPFRYQVQIVKIKK